MKILLFIRYKRIQLKPIKTFTDIKYNNLTKQIIEKLTYSWKFWWRNIDPVKELDNKQQENKEQENKEQDNNNEDNKEQDNNNEDNKEDNNNEYNKEQDNNNEDNKEQDNKNEDNNDDLSQDVHVN